MSTLPPLRREELAAIRRDRAGLVSVPDDALLDLPERAVQFGTGALLRGFVDDFLHRANEQGLFQGRVVAVASTGSARDRALREQDGLYTLAVQGIVDGQPVEEYHIVSSVSRAISAATEWNDVLALARAPGLEVVFSNTTEVGIALDSADAPDAAPPASFPAKLTRFLHERARAFDHDPAAGVVVVPCELIENNGDTLRRLVLTLAERWALGADFTRWIERAVPFCNTLVDRIVPGAPSGDEASGLAARLGYSDALLTTCEPYRLFAIEGDAALRARLPWTAVDPAILVVPDIAPYRERKVRLLNGAHTTLAPAALLAGRATVREAVTDPTLGPFLRHAMFEEIVPTLHVNDASAFAEAVVDRFRNPFIRHALVDITLQATMKMRVRVVPSILAYAARTGRPPQSLAFGFACFVLYMRDDHQAARRGGTRRVPADDGAERLAAHWAAAGADTARLARAACGDVELWGTDLAAVPGFVDAVAAHLRRAASLGVIGALEHHLATPVT